MIPTASDLVTEGLDRLSSQFQESPVITELLKAFLESIRDTEDGLLQLLSERGISTAIGVQLDLIGKIVNEPRMGRGDEDYRQALYIRIFINNSEGTPNEILQALRISTQATRTDYWEHHPASFHLLSNGSVNDATAKAMKMAAPAGVGDVLVYSDPFNDGHVPCEVALDLIDIVDNLNNNIVTQDDDGIAAVSSTPSGAIEKAILAEILPADFILAGGSDFAVTDNGVSLYAFSVVTDVEVETTQIEAVLRTHEGSLTITDSDFVQGAMLIDYIGEVPTATADGILMEVYTSLEE